MAPTTFKDQIRGFPFWQMAVLSLIRFSEPISFTSLFPYVFYMVRDFKIAPSEHEIPKYTAYLASSYALCQFVFAVRWGKLSDRIGRKKVLLCGLFGTSMSLILFGFSRNFYMALFARCMAGSLNGNVSVLRTVIGEIATEKRHQALAFLMLPLLFNFGSVIGPSIGGSKWLTRPSSHNPYGDTGAAAAAAVSNFAPTGSSVYERFITKYPYALSNVVVLCFLWFSLVCGFLFLEETHDELKHQRDYGVELGDWILHRVFGIKPRLRPWQVSSELAPLLSDNSSVHSQPFEDENSPPSPVDDSDVGSLNPFGDDTKPHLSRSLSLAIVRTYSNHNEAQPPSEDKYKGAFTPQVITAISGNFIISLHNVVYSEFLPVFLAARFQRDKLAFPYRIGGGFGLDSNSIGTLFSSTGIMGMVIVLLIFPYLDRKLGTINGYRLLVSIFPFVYFLVPWSIFTLPGYNPRMPLWVTPITLYCLTSLKTLASATGMPQMMILQHRAASKKHRAYVNSSTMSIIALARFSGPLIFGYVMSFGDQHQVSYVSWWLLALLATFGFVQSFWMRDWDDE